MFPENIVQATFQQVQTNYVPIKPKLQRFPQNNGSTAVASAVNSSEVLMKPVLEYTNEVCL